MILEGRGAQETLYGRADRVFAEAAEAGTAAGEICGKIYAGMGVAEIRRLKQLEDENGTLKRLVAVLKEMASLCPPSVRGERRRSAASGEARPSPRAHPTRAGCV